MSAAAEGAGASAQRARRTGRFAIAAGGAGVLAAMLLPRAPVGLGFVVAAVALAGAVALAPRPGPWTMRSLLLGALALALAASAAVRDAGWVVDVSSSSSVRSRWRSWRGALRWACTETAGQARVLRALLCALCLLTLVVLASALHRVGLYEQAYGFTRARLAVHGLLLFGGAIFALVVVALAGDRREWLAPATVLLAAAAALGSGSATRTGGSPRTTSSATRRPAGSTRAICRG